jgi:hypothetical protein
MKVSPKDMPKVVLLVAGIIIAVVIIGSTLTKHGSDVAKETADKAAKAAATSNIVSGQPVQTAALEPSASPQQYVEQIENWSKPPTAQVTGSPFREVLPRDIARSLSEQRNLRGSVPNPIGGGANGFGPGFHGGFDPTNPGLPNVQIDFPTIMVTGVVVGTESGSFATLRVNDVLRFAKEGEVLGNGLVVEKVTQRGVQIRAAKEHAFIEVSKSYKPNGMAPPAPPKAASHRHSSRRHS